MVQGNKIGLQQCVAVTSLPLLWTSWKETIERSMDTIWLSLLVILILALANGFFAASEIAVVSVRRGRLQQRADNGDRKAQIALQLAEEPNRFLATIQIGITLIGTLAGVYGGDVLSGPVKALLAPYIGMATAQEVALLLVVALVSYISLVVGELVPKRLALQHAEAIATFSAPFMRVISRFTAPLVWFLSASAQGILALLGANGEKEEQITEEDILSLVREGAERGAVESTERDIIERVFDFSDVSVRSIMTPRTEVFAISIETPLDDAVRAVIASGHSRVPVYGRSRDVIKGVLYSKDLLGMWFDNEKKTLGLVAELLREPAVVLEHQHVSEVMQHFKRTGTDIVLVVDEYGQMEGVVTADDLLETFTGYVAGEQEEVERLVRRSDGSYLVDGALPYVTAERRIGLPPRSTITDLPEFETIAGLMLALLRRIPATGEWTTWEGWRFEIVDLDGNRIDKVLVSPQGKLDHRAQNEAALAFGAMPGFALPSAKKGRR